MLLTLEDLKEKIDFAKTKNLTPFQWLLELTPIALEKLHRQEKYERLLREKALKRPIAALPPPTLAQHDDAEEQKDDRDYRPEVRKQVVPSKKRKLTVLDGAREKRRSNARRRRRKIERDYFVGDPRVEGAKIPERFRRYIETELKGKDIKLMLQKHLYETDLKPNEGRLSMPLIKVWKDVLTGEEEKQLRTRGGIGNPVPSMELKLVDPMLREGRIVLKLWEMKKPTGKTSYMYVLAKYWNNVVKDHGLEVGEVVQVWGFRMGGGELGLALVRLDEENGGEV